MRSGTTGAVRAAVLALVMAACGGGDVIAPDVARVDARAASTAGDTIWISEIHYDNASTDVGEAIEIAGPAGTDLTNWSVVLYNGNGGAPYDTRLLSGAIPAVCSPRGVVVLNYATNGIQNGAPDGVALVDDNGVVYEFLSYEGTFTAVGGPADGMQSRDIGVSESGSAPAGSSLQRQNATTWTEAAATFGACNDDTTPPPPPPPPPPPGPAVRFTEIHYDNGGTDVDEAIEITGPAGTDLSGWSVVLYNGNGGGAYATTVLTGALPTACGAEGTLVVTYPSNGIQNGSPDGFALVDATGAVVEFLSYEGDFAAADGPAAGMTSVDIGVSEGTSASAVESLQRINGVWQGPLARTFGPCNAAGGPGAGGGQPGEPSAIALSRFDSDYHVVAGFQKPLFATVTDGTGAQLNDVALTWTSSDAATASVDALGYVTGHQPGGVTITATAANGVSGTRAFVIRPFDPATTAQYGDHVSFGTPADATPADDFVIERAQYVASYNGTRGNPNWVAWNLNATHFGPAERCECFTPDPLVPASLVQATDFDYRSSGYSRGHMAMSENRTTTDAQNAATFYMSNILPQSSANNGGPWLTFEIFLNDLARQGNRELYIVAGGEFSASPATLKNEGKVQIPEFTWKVAVVVDAGEDLDDVRTWQDLEVHAIRTPNTLSNTPTTNDWRAYATTVDDIEARTGYDLLAGLPDLIERFVERGSVNAAPAVDAGGPYAGVEGQPVTLSATASDADADALSFAWTFGDGGSAAGATVTHTYATPGTYTATVAVTDGIATTTVSTTVNVRALTPCEQLTGIRDELADIERANRGSKVGDRIEDALAKTVTAHHELCVKRPPDAQAATGAVEGAVGDLEHAPQAGLAHDVAEELMRRLLRVSRDVADAAIQAAVDRGADAKKIDKARGWLADAIAFAADGKFKQAAGRLQKAVAEAEGA